MSSGRLWRSRPCSGGPFLCYSVSSSWLTCVGEDVVIKVSRSAVVTRKTCAMKRYWAYHAPHPDTPSTAQIGGLTPTVDASADAKARGSLFHALMEAATNGQDIDAAAAAYPVPDLSPTLVALCRRAAKGWRQVRAEFLTEYQPISAEMEWEWAMSPFVTQTLRLDQILRHRATDELLIVDYKTLGRPDDNWVYRLWHSDQTHLYVQALIERTHEPVAMQYEGIIIGTYEKGVYKSPFVSAFVKHGHLSAKWVPGATRLDISHWPDDQWMAWITEQQGLHDLYCTTGLIQPTTAALLATKNATAHAELQWADTLADLQTASDEETRALWRETRIEKNPEACYKYGRGYACPYVPLCWHGQRPDMDTFTPRADHHATREGAA